MRGSTGSFFGDIVVYAIIGVILWVIAFIWKYLTGGDKDDKGK
jgi:hypothetical protein